MLSLEIVQRFTLVLIKRARLCTAEQLSCRATRGACSIVTTFCAARVPHVLFWRGDYLNGEFKGGEQVDEFAECEFVDVRLE